ncbi:hypothetical protein [Sphingopyxis chilensis]
MTEQVSKRNPAETKGTDGCCGGKQHSSSWSPAPDDNVRKKEPHQAPASGKHGCCG